uniref:Uncharacterized protein n=1 Tax=Glossina pallidipes TaxID=7398 RepID=A0A1B0AHE6_GLOPL
MLGSMHLSMDVNQKPIHYLSRGGYKMVFINKDEKVTKSMSMAPRNFEQVNDLSACLLSVNQPTSQLANQPTNQPASQPASHGARIILVANNCQ